MIYLIMHTRHAFCLLVFSIFPLALFPRVSLSLSLIVLMVEGL